MLIGVDASRSVATIQKTGVEKVSDELLKQFVNLQNKEIKFVYYTPQKIDWLSQENQKILHWPFKFFWTQIRLAWELIFHAPDVMFFPVHAMPLFLFFIRFIKNKTHYYRVIHDIAFIKKPHIYSFKQKIILNLDLWLAKKICTKIFVPTWAVKDDLIKYTKIKSEKIVVVEWGYKTLNNEFEVMNYGERKKQILYLGRVEEKKNIANLIKAFEIFNEKKIEYKLILAGQVSEEFKKDVLKYKDIEFLGFISEEKKHELLLESAALVLVSKEEGFGIPLLEAFDFGLPVVASDIPVLREVGAEACLYVNPNLPEEIASALEKIVSDEKIQQNLIVAGQERLKNFSWEKTAQKILNEIIK